MEKFKKYATIGLFLLLIFGLLILHIALPDQELSYSERRKLETFPKATLLSIKDGSFFDDLESYLLDHFPLRETFRGIKADLHFDLFRQLDKGGLYRADGQLMELDPVLDEKQLALAINKINAVISAHPEAASYYFSIIPDKNYFLASKNGYPAMDYEKLISSAKDGVSAAYIDILPLLSLSDYYNTVSHWKQENILPVAEKLLAEMGNLPHERSYTTHELEGYFGVYAGQAAVSVPADTLRYLTDEVTENALVTSLEQDSPLSVYSDADFKNVDPYDVYLSGAEALLTIENPLAENKKHLILFRDSFGSSIAPLLLGEYSRITVVDLRYIRSDLLSEYLDFTGADVLFLYSTGILNNGSILK